MPLGIGFGPGLQRLLDAHQMYTQATTPVFLRIRNFANPAGTLWSQLGFTIAPSGTVTGTVDIPILPPPSMSTLSLRDIGLNGGKLRFGAKRFMISATWVSTQQNILNLTDPKLIFSGQQTVGIVNENMLYSIEDIQHEAVAGYITEWILICNANEQR